MISNSKTQSNTNKPDSLMVKVVNFGAVILIIIIVVLVYKFFIVKDYNKLRIEGFYESTDATDTTDTTDTKDATDTIDTTDTTDILSTISKTTTIYEQSLIDMYGDNKRLICGMIPSMGGSSGICQINNSPVVVYQFPIHIIKLINGNIVAVFNDGRLYLKDSMKSTIWSGPITNSLPQDIIPLRMITLSTDLVSVLGVGYDNNLYVKSPDIKGNIDLTSPWKKVPNNSSIIYVIFDAETNFLLSIDTNGKLFTKTTADISSNNQELVSKIDRPILRLYYDINGYVLVIDNKFNLYQIHDIKWKTSVINTSRGANSSKIQDLLYDNDGKLFGLVFNQNAFMVQIMKQNNIFYLSDFVSLDMQLTANTSSTDFVMADQDIIKCKIGSLNEYISSTNDDETIDDDPNFAYQKQIIENQNRLRNFCKTRNNTSGSNNYDNYDLLASVDTNNDKIIQLKNIINNLMTYEPDSVSIKEKYQILN